MKRGTRGRWSCRTLLGLALLGSAAGVRPATAQVLLREQCATVVDGKPIRGVMQVEYLRYSDTHRVYGLFGDPQGNRIELEVLTNQPRGVGSMWFNSARHREIRIDLSRVPGGYIVATEDGAVVRLECR